MSLRIAVIDINKRIYPLLMKMGGIEVVLLYGPSDSEIDNSDISSCTKFIRKLEPSTWNKTFISKEDILKYRSTQLKVERFAQRYNVIPSYATSQYYHSLAFWEYYLCKKSIDCLLITSTEHGSILDSVPIAIAKSRGIPVFLFDTLYGDSHNIYLAILCENTGKYVNLKEIDPSVSLPDMTKIHIPSSESIPDNTQLLDEVLDRDPLTTNGIKKIIFCMLKKMIILHSTISTRLLAIFGLQVPLQRYYKKDIDLVVAIYEFFTSFKFIVVSRGKKYDAHSMDVGDLYANLLKKRIYLSALKRYYRKHSKKYIDPETDGILYGLHFEPEASIMNRTTYDSQIYNIEMLSSVLPQGWKIFVKEHPAQFASITPDMLQYYNQIPIYRRKTYYERFMKIPNVILVDDRIPSSEFINSKKYPNIHAISTINGTIAAESISAGKPVIMFGSESTVYGDISGIFNVSDHESLKNAIDDLVSGNVLVDCKKIEKIAEYLIEVNLPCYTKQLMLHFSEKTLLTLITYSKKIAEISEY